MPVQAYTKKQYEDEFLADENITQRALENALDIRKFEIGLYWTRAAYFWAFTGAALAGFITVESTTEKSTDALVLLANLGFVFSFAWLCVNKGSKHWQENWERHVDLLEDKVNGPLYKVVMQYKRTDGAWNQVVHVLTGPAPFSVSKVNLVISLFVTIMWLVLLVHSLPIDFDAPISGYYVTLCSISLAICFLFLTICRSKDAKGNEWATKRTNT